MQASYEEKETRHRVIVGREYYEPFGLEPQEVIGRAITHLIRKKVPRQTEGAVPPLLDADVLARLVCATRRGLPVPRQHVVLDYLSIA